MYCNLRTENEHRISRVSLRKAMNVIHISANAADLSDHLPSNVNDRFDPTLLAS